MTPLPSTVVCAGRYERRALPALRLRAAALLPAGPQDLPSACLHARAKERRWLPRRQAAVIESVADFMQRVPCIDYQRFSHRASGQFRVVTALRP